jgi:hypothetical protein
MIRPHISIPGSRGGLASATNGFRCTVLIKGSAMPSLEHEITLRKQNILGITYLADIPSPVRDRLY